VAARSVSDGGESGEEVEGFVAGQVVGNRPLNLPSSLFSYAADDRSQSPLYQPIVAQRPKIWERGCRYPW